MNNYRKEFEQAAQKEGFDVDTDSGASIHIYKSILVDALWEGFQACLAGVHYNAVPCGESAVHAEHWQWGWRMADEIIVKGGE